MQLNPTSPTATIGTAKCDTTSMIPSFIVGGVCGLVLAFLLVFAYTCGKNDKREVY